MQKNQHAVNRNASNLTSWRSKTQSDTQPPMQKMHQLKNWLRELVIT